MDVHLVDASVNVLAKLSNVLIGVITASGKRRIHKTPSRTEVVACRRWLFAELRQIEPTVVVLLGATAAKSLLGNDFRLTEHRGEILHVPEADASGGDAPALVVTMHPSAVLRGPSETRDEALDGLVDDLRFAVAHVSP